MSDELLKHVQQNPPRCLVGLRTALFEEPAKGRPHSVTFVLAMRRDDRFCGGSVQTWGVIYGIFGALLIPAVINSIRGGF